MYKLAIITAIVGGGIVALMFLMLEALVQSEITVYL